MKRTDKKTPLETDIDTTLRSAAGRRVFSWLTRDVHVGFNADPLAMAYNLGLMHAAQALDDRLKDINPEAWLILKREELTPEDEEKPNEPE